MRYYCSARETITKEKQMEINQIPGTPTPEMQKLGADVGLTVDEAKEVIAAYKAGGLKAVAGLSGKITSVLKQDYDDVVAALPQIKSGYKTTEFWLGVVAICVPLVAALLGHPLPAETVLPVAAVASIYMFVRALAKKPTPPAA